MENKPRCLQIVLAVVLGLMLPSAPVSAALLSDTFVHANGVITNEYAYYNRYSPSAIKSPIWQLTSGSFLASGNQGWSGVPDVRTVNATSTTGTGSAIFRMTTKRTDFQNVVVSFRLLNQGLTSTSRTPPLSTDGVNLWLRHQTETYLYAVALNRRDNKIVVKKKTTGGPENGGTYSQIGAYTYYRVPYRTWVRVQVSIRNNSDSSVTISVYMNGVRKLTVKDTGTGGSPIRTAGRIGIRGDNCNFKVDDLVIDSYASGTTAAVAGAPSAVMAAEETPDPVTDILVDPPEVEEPTPTVDPESAEGIVDPSASQAPTQVGVMADLNQARVFPNPWRVDEHSTQDITFDRLTDPAHIRIFNVAGEFVRELDATGGAATWDRKNASGDPVASGIYLYLITNNRDHKHTGKLVVIK